MATPGKLEAAPEADRSADQLSWTWVDWTDLTEANATTITRGRSSPRAGVSDPAQGTFPLRNGGGDTGITAGSLTPRKGTGLWYPGIRRGLPMRYSFHAGQSWLALPGTAGGNATTPDAASWAISPDIAIAIQFRAPLRFPRFGFSYEIMGQFTTSGNQRAWLLFLSADGTLRLRISSNGTAESDSQTSLAIPSPDGGPLTVAAVFDGDNGAGGNTTTWHLLKGTIATLLASPSDYLFGDPDTNSGTLTIHNSTGTVGIGDVPGSGFAPYPGGIDRVYVRGGTLTTGTVVADADFTAEAAGTGSFADDAATPKTWTINAGAAITDRKTRLLGEYGTSKGTFPGGAVDGTAQRTISVLGPLSRMRIGEKPLQSALRRLVTAPETATTVRVYFPLEDGRDATRVFSPIGGNQDGTVSMALAADDTLPASLPLPSVSGGQSFGWNLSFPPITSVSTWEFTMLVKIPVAPVAASSEFIDLCRIDCIGGVTSSWVLRIDDTDVSLFAKDFDNVNVLSVTQGADDRMFGTWMIVTLAIGLSGANITWRVDLTPTPLGATFTDSGTLASLAQPAGTPVRLRNLDEAVVQEGMSVGHFIITEGAATGWLAPGDTAFVGEPDTQRVFRLCREQGIPVIVDGPYDPDWEVAIAAGAVAMGPQRALPFLELLNECAVAGRGWLGEAREVFGGLSYRSGCTALEQDPALSTGLAQTAEFTSSDDTRDYRNQVEAKRPNGSTAVYTASGDDHPDTAGLYEDSYEVNIELDDDLEAHAAWFVHQATWPEERHDTVPVEVAVEPALLDTLHSFSVGDVVEATALPAAAASSSIAQIVDGWTETPRPGSWGWRPNTRPAGPLEVGFLDDDPASPDTDAARIDSTGTTLTGTLSDSATGGQSVTVTGTLWTTSADYQPMVIRIDEEQIELSAISGGASPQTFTISARGVNDTDPAEHAAGAEIHPARPIRKAPTRRFP